MDEITQAVSVLSYGIHTSHGQSDCALFVKLLEAIAGPDLSTMWGENSA